MATLSAPSTEQTRATGPGGRPAISTPPTGNRRRYSVTKGRPAGRVLAYAFAILGILVSFFPVYLMLVTSVMPNSEITSGKVSFFPKGLTFIHYSDAVGKDLFFTKLANSALVSVSATLATIVVAFLAAIALGRFRFRGRTIYIVVLLIVQMIPLEALIIPVYLMMNGAGLRDHYIGLIGIYLVFNLPFAIWTLRSFVVSVPVDLEEQAMIDGCSRLGAFWRVLLPLTIPGIVATAVYAFIQTWSELIFALVIMQSAEKQTLPVWINSFSTPKGTDWGALMAGSVLFTLPVVVMFLFVYRRIATGLAAGAVKG